MTKSSRLRIDLDKLAAQYGIDVLVVAYIEGGDDGGSFLILEGGVGKS